jgi:hypothetical protein
MERATRAEALNSSDLATLVLHGKGKAGIDALPIDQDSAGATRPLITALLRTEEVHVLAQKVQEGGPHIHVPLHFAAINNPAH